MKKRLFHRSYNIENTTGSPDGWKTTINGNAISGRLALLKKSVDWWCDMKTFLPPESFAREGGSQNQQAASNVENYKGFKLMNDSGKPNEWYIILRGQLLKGSPVAIKRHLDLVLEKLSKK